MILQEIKINSIKLEEIIKKYKAKYEVMAQDAIGTAGGLEMRWNSEEVQVKDWVSLPRSLSGKFRMIGYLEWVVIIGVYGPHIPREHKYFLKHRQTIKGLFPLIPWIVGGDFNMIKALEETQGSETEQIRIWKPSEK